MRRCSVIAICQVLQRGPTGSYLPTSEDGPAAANVDLHIGQVMVRLMRRRT